jgi:hypothetical protein
MLLLYYFIHVAGNKRDLILQLQSLPEGELPPVGEVPAIDAPTEVKQNRAPLPWEPERDQEEEELLEVKPDT